MLVIDDILRTQPELGRVVLTAGSFDGIHRGHLRVIDDVTRRARALDGAAAVLTMRPHPRELFAPDHAPNLLTSETKKLELLEAAGVEAVFFLPFTESVANLTPRAFVDRILAGQCRARVIVVGHDFHFGRNAEGDYAFLAQCAEAAGFEVFETPPLFVHGERVSSTLIRERVLQGDLERVAEFLGRRYALLGQVAAGRGVGAELGFPTANIEPHHSAIPAHGVYVAEAVLRGQDRRCMAAVNIGVAPTIRQADIVVEAHLLDFEGDLRGRPIELVFHRRLRGEQKFPGRAALIAQIERDVAAVRAYFADEAD